MVEPDQILEIVEIARTTGKIKKGANEVTKALERGKAKMVVVAQDTNPKEIVMHLQLLAKEKDAKYYEVPKKEDLGAAAGLQVGTAAIAITEPGEAKKQLDKL